VIHERDRQTDRRTLDDSKDRACIASRGKNRQIVLKIFCQTGFLWPISASCDADVTDPKKMTISHPCIKIGSFVFKIQADKRMNGQVKHNASACQFGLVEV